VRTARTLVLALSGLLAVAAVVLAVASFVDGVVLLGMLWAVVAAAAVWSVVQEVRRPDRTAASQQALAEWPPERVRTTVGHVDGEIARVRALRAADRRLALADAVTLVRGSGA
jgi:hypothetical protein